MVRGLYQLALLSTWIDCSLLPRNRSTTLSTLRALFGAAFTAEFINTMHIIVNRGAGCFHIYTAKTLSQTASPNAAARELLWTDYHSEWDATNFINRNFRDSYELSQLRSALAFEIYDVTRWADEKVRSAASARLKSGAWQVAYEDSPKLAIPSAAGSPTTPLPASGTAPIDPVARAFSTPSRQPKSIPAPAQSKVRVDAPVQEESEWSDEELDQIAQAETFEKAARDGPGIPFIEICEACRQNAQGSR